MVPDVTMTTDQTAGFDIWFQKTLGPCRFISGQRTVDANSVRQFCWNHLSYKGWDKAESVMSSMPAEKLSPSWEAVSQVTLEHPRGEIIHQQKPSNLFSPFYPCVPRLKEKKPALFAWLYIIRYSWTPHKLSALQLPKKYLQSEKYHWPHVSILKQKT